jgi:hypothetical protein
MAIEKKSNFTYEKNGGSFNGYVNLPTFLNLIYQLMAMVDLPEAITGGTAASMFMALVSTHGTMGTGHSAYRGDCRDHGDYGPTASALSKMGPPTGHGLGLTYQTL